MKGKEQMRLGDLDALKQTFAEYGEKAKFTQGACQQLIDNAQTVSIKSCGECPFVADEEKQITNGDAWSSYCEGQEVGFKKAEDVFERMKLIQETVDCIRNTFNRDTESDKLVRNCMALVQNAIDGEYHDMEEVDVSEIERPHEEKSYAMGYQDGLEDGLQDIREQGEWLKADVGLFKCSVCGRYICTSISDDKPYIDYPFCHCGAGMKGGVE